MLFFLFSEYVFRVKEAGTLQEDTRKHNESGNGCNEVSGVTARGGCGRGLSGTGGEMEMWKIDGGGRLLYSVARRMHYQVETSS